MSDKARAELMLHQPADEQPDFEPGDVVCLQGGGPVMTVVKRSNMKVAAAYAMANGQIVVSELPVRCFKKLTRVPVEAIPPADESDVVVTQPAGKPELTLGKDNPTDAESKVGAV